MEMVRTRLLLNRIILSAIFAFANTFTGVAAATIIESGTLNFISDVGNPSNGLAFLDMTFSVGLSEADALSNAQLTYADTRLATAAEFDDLYVAAGVTYSGTSTASSGFDIGPNIQLAASGDTGIANLILALGTTGGPNTFIWTDPDSFTLASTTRDFIHLLGTGESLAQQSSQSMSHEMRGWLLVSDSAVVPEPSTALLVALGLGCLGIRRR